MSIIKEARFLLSLDSLSVTAGAIGLALTAKKEMMFLDSNAPLYYHAAAVAYGLISAYAAVTGMIGVFKEPKQETELEKKVKQNQNY